METSKARSLLKAKPTGPWPSCKEYVGTPEDKGDGAYKITGSGAEAFDVYCDMTTEGGGWIKLTTDKPTNYWITGDTDMSKCGADGGPKFADGKTGASIKASDCENCNTGPNKAGEHAVIAYSSNGVELTAAQMEAIRGVSTQLSSHTKLFGAACDDDVEQNYVSNKDCRKVSCGAADAQHEVYSKAVDGSRFMLIPTNGADNKWITYTYPSEVAEIKYLLPERFTYHHAATGQAHGGAEAVGWECDGCDPDALYILTK